MPSYISHFSDPSTATATASASYHLVFLITGNPGLISYYSTFLSTLHNLLQTNSSDIFHIYGQSLAGFDDGDDISTPDPSQSRTSSQNHPYSLEQQIQILFTTLQQQRIPSGPHISQPYTNIILIGHSVGSYILLELLSRLRKLPSSSLLRLRAGILLFPTITHIAQSPSGVKISTLFRIPDFPRRAAAVARTLVRWTPVNVLRWVVGFVTGMEESAREVTVGFLRSRFGVWQALHMAKDEMETITEDRWDDDIWGVEHEEDDSKTKPPKLIFYFGQNDHWVADHTRDALIAVRGGTKGSGALKPAMLIDENGIDHGFCIRHSETVAGKVAVWIEDALRGWEEELRDS